MKVSNLSRKAAGLEYDLIVIGSGPAGQRAAIQAAKSGKRVVIIEKQSGVAGVCANTGTIPSKTMREAVLHLSGFYNQGFYGANHNTIPQISFIGKTEEQLTDEDVPYEVGVAYYREIARRQISGQTEGRLKPLFHRETLELLGVHIFGEDATELPHIGQAVLLLKGKVSYFKDTVFNYPTLAEC
jgi:pyruvate/2-oxoglutarate dehydrogenase complex dihydrolipoamide dehydrogenase (E3) component